MNTTQRVPVCIKPKTKILTGPCCWLQLGYNIIQTSSWVSAYRSTKNGGQREDKLVEEALLGGILAFLPVWIQIYLMSIKWCKWYPSAGSFASTFDPLRKIKLKTYFVTEKAMQGEKIRNGEIERQLALHEPIAASSWRAESAVCCLIGDHFRIGNTNNKQKILLFLSKWFLIIG